MSRLALFCMTWYIGIYGGDTVTRIRIIFDANEDYRKKLKILAAEKSTSVNQIIYEAIQKTYGIEPPGEEMNTETHK